MGLIRVPVSLPTIEGNGDSYSADFLVDIGSTDTLVPANALQRLGVVMLESLGFTVDPVTQTLKRLPVLPLKPLAA